VAVSAWDEAFGYRVRVFRAFDANRETKGDWLYSIVCVSVPCTIQSTENFDVSTPIGTLKQASILTSDILYTYSDLTSLTWSDDAVEQIQPEDVLQIITPAYDDSQAWYSVEGAAKDRPTMDTDADCDYAKFYLAKTVRPSLTSDT